MLLESDPAINSSMNYTTAIIILSLPPCSWITQLSQNTEHLSLTKSPLIPQLPGAIPTIQTSWD